MAGEIIAAFRTVMLFISLSWLSVMYLLVYRVPKLNDVGEFAKYEIIDGVVREEKYSRNARTSLILDGDVKLFGEDSSDMKLDLSNPSAQLVLDKKGDEANGKSPHSTNLSQRTKALGIPKLRNIDSVLGSFDCRLLERMKTYEVLGKGYTKVVRRGVIYGQSFAIKYTTGRNHDVIKCKKERPVNRQFECFNLAKFKLLKEALLFNQLRHRNIIKVYGVCPWAASDVDEKESVLTVITELGEPLDLIKMIQIPWDIRFKMAIDMVDLLLYLDDTSIGSLLIKDFRIEQFVLKDGTLKLADLDDLDGRKKLCSFDRDCFIGSSTMNTTVPCIYERCQNYSQALNLYNLFKVFLDYSLNFDNPVWISSYFKSLSKDISTFQIRLQDLSKELRRIALNIRRGYYAKSFIKSSRNTSVLHNFEMFTDAAIMGSHFDYYCIGSRSLTACEIVVSDIEVARITCSLSSECKAIVVRPEKNWLGQRIVVFKSSGRSLTPVTKHTTFVKVS